MAGVPISWPVHPIPTLHSRAWCGPGPLDCEEKVLLARGEITMFDAGIAVNSKTLAEQLPRRSSEAIKKTRQSEEYKRIL